jgi:hypothetical protein
VIEPHACAAAPKAVEVTLIDGRIVCSCSEEWKQECWDREQDAKHIAWLPLGRRRENLRALGERSPLARKRMEAVLLRMFEAAKAARGEE